jgi:PAS domain S-box-containing protein
MSSRIKPTGKEVYFQEDEIIVSKTDLTGKIMYANDIFLKIAGFSEEEVLGMPHSLIRHPDMPRAIFKLFWDTLSSGNEIFAYVCNMCKNGDHYWVLAHATPSFDEQGQIIGYHSNRRVPERSAVEAAQTLYRTLLTEERRHTDPRKGLDASYALLRNLLENAGKPYEEFIWSVGQ